MTTILYRLVAIVYTVVCLAVVMPLTLLSMIGRTSEKSGLWMVDRLDYLWSKARE